MYPISWEKICQVKELFSTQEGCLLAHEIFCRIYQKNSELLQFVLTQAPLRYKTWLEMPWPLPQEYPQLFSWSAAVCRVINFSEPAEPYFIRVAPTTIAVVDGRFRQYRGKGRYLEEHPELRRGFISEWLRSEIQQQAPADEILTD